MIAFLFPGQGSQSVGMGKALYEGFPEAKAVFDAADDDQLGTLRIDAPDVPAHAIAGVEHPFRIGDDTLDNYSLGGAIRVKVDKQGCLDGLGRIRGRRRQKQS